MQVTLRGKLVNNEQHDTSKHDVTLICINTKGHFNHYSALLPGVLQCRAEKNRAVQCKVKQYRAVKFRTEQLTTMKWITKQCSAVQYMVMYCRTVQCSAIYGKVVQHSALQCRSGLTVTVIWQSLSGYRDQEGDRGEWKMSRYFPFYCVLYHGSWPFILCISKVCSTT